MPVTRSPVYPWVIDINPFMPPSTQTNWSSVFALAGAIGGGTLGSGGAQNDAIGWDVLLGAGTWTIQIMFRTASSRGIYNVQLDGVTVGTVDGYNASATLNNVGSVAGVVVAPSGKKRLSLVMATKNGSSSGYSAELQGVALRRTA